MLRYVVFLTLIFASVSECPAQGRASNPAAYAAAKEMAVVERLAADFADHHRADDDPAVVDFIQSVGQTIARAARLPFPLTLRVIHSAEPATHTLPGGFVFVSPILISRLSSEAELAGWLAHQIAHVAAHQSNPASPSHQGVKTIVALTHAGGLCARVEAQSLPLSMRAEFQQREENADLLALQYLHEGGYDPAGMIGAVARLQSGGAPSALQPTAAVFEKLEEYLQTDRRYVSTTSAFSDAQLRLATSNRMAARRPSLLE
jgi:predicted Zn-dependent protease